jgi:hypothetical protein
MLIILGIKCQSPTDHIKFSFKIHMHHSYVEFNLDEGHSNVFLGLKPKFIVAFRDCFDNLEYIGSHHSSPIGIVIIIITTIHNYSYL